MKNINKVMLIIADDLTGANDTGVQFARQGLHTEVLLEGTMPAANTEASIVVVDTNSRSISASEAYQKVQEVARRGFSAGFSGCYKKIDSTLRGNIGAELQAILDLGLHDFAFIMPAFPKNGRTTIGGYHLLHGIPLASTEMVHDPKNPVKETLLPELLARQTGRLVRHIGIKELLEDENCIAATIRRYRQEGCTMISCDAWLEEHFYLAIKAVQQVSNKVLWCGSAGLAEYLPRVLGMAVKRTDKEPVLVVAGSVSSVTRDQVNRLVQEGFELIELAPQNCLNIRNIEDVPCVNEALNCLSVGKNVVLASGYNPYSIQLALDAGTKLGMSHSQISNLIADMLGKIGAAVLQQAKVAGVVLTGGDTAVSVCQSLGVTGIRVLSEVAPGIPLGKMKTANGQTLRVVTKAGAFGTPDALLQAASVLGKEVNS